MPEAGSLRYRIAVALAVVSTLVWIAGGAVTVWVARHESSEVLDGQLAQTARFLAVLPTDEFERHARAPESLAPPGSRYEQEMALQMWNRGGQLVFASPEAPPAAMPSPAELAQARTLQIDGRRWRARAAANAHTGHVIQVLAQGEIGAGFAADAVRYFGFSAALSLPLLLLLGWLALRRALTPLDRLRSEVAARRPEDLTPMRVDGVPSEIGGLVEAINGLSRRHAQLLAGVRRFTGDAAHELRTPIAAIRLHAQVARSENDQAWRDASLQEIEMEAGRTSALLEQLFALAHLDHAELDYQSADCELSLLALQAAAVDPRIVVRLPQGEVRARCIPELIELALRNLVSNAIRHGGTGPIAIEISPAPGQARIAVEDDGPGIPAEHAEAVFEPFFRVPGTGTGGSGLGLSIVRRIAQAHGGTARVEPASRAGGTRVVMEIRVREPGWTRDTHRATENPN